MSLARDRCICLRKTEYSETSQILTLFARNHGLIRTIAKGAHRTTKAGASKFGGGIDLLDLADAVSPDRGGVLCRNCENSFPQRLSLNSRLLGIMQLFTTNGTTRLPILTRHQTDPINKLLAEYIEHTLGRRLRLPKFVIAAR